MEKIPAIHIAGRRIASNEPPYVIAELSANHNGSLSSALQIIAEAKAAGADAVKLQTYTADTITLDCDSEAFQIRGGLWAGKTLHELYNAAFMPWDWHKPLFEHAHKLGITIFSSAFDISAVDLLEDLNTPAYKIASFEAIDLPLIRYVASTGKPIIISTGMADAQEIGEAVEAASEGGCDQIALLHCVSGYPAPAEEYSLKTIPDIIQRFELVTGLSDHTLGLATAIASVALGAAIIEKHFTLNRDGGGPDDSFSLEPREFRDLCSEAKTAWSALGEADYKMKSSEHENIKFRRSLYYVKSLRAGETLTEHAVRSVRPGYGLPPKYFDEIVGRKLRRDVEINTPCSLEDFVV